MKNSFLLKVKRGETPFFRLLRTIAKGIVRGNLPLPRFFNPVLGVFYKIHMQLWFAIRWALSFFYREPIFRGRCISVGKRFWMTDLPEVVGHTQIRIGDDVTFFGKIGIYSGRVFDHPLLEIGSRVSVGHNVTFVVNKEIVIEDDVFISTGVRFMDSDSHPRDTAERIANAPPKPEEIKPVRVSKYAWIGQNAFILKGVTIGEGAIVGVNSVVVTDVPAYSVAMGNPARVVVKNLTRVDSTAEESASPA